MYHKKTYQQPHAAPGISANPVKPTQEQTGGIYLKASDVFQACSKSL